MSKKNLKVLIIVIAVFVALGLFGALSDSEPKSAEAPVEVAAEAVQPIEQKYVLPDQDVFLNYVKEQFYLMTDSGALDLDTILIDPVEIEVRKYELNSTGTPDISLTAYVKEMELGLQGREITSAIVLITLKWLIEQGFEPQKEWIMPICSIMRRESGVTGQDMVRVFGRSIYDFNTDSIDWSPAR
ncbi:MAG: hypothetical protein LBT95_01920 [Treponema sp.]|jgi:hypothetical protein|nr:hypothetical protein [Treponema sp.]